MLDDQVSAAVKVYCFSKRCFDLFCNPKGIKNRSTILVKGNDIRFFRCYALNIGLGVIKNIAIVDNYLIEIFIQQITAGCSLFLVCSLNILLERCSSFQITPG